MARSLLTFGITLFFAAPLLGQWMQTNGPFGGPVHELVVKGSSLFVASATAVYRSTNNGSIWDELDVNLAGVSVSSLAANETTVFVADWGKGVLRTIDDGANWTDVSIGLTETNITSLIADSTHVFAGTQSGLFRSTNSGATWEKLDSMNVSISCVTIKDTLVFAATYEPQVYRSTDNGTSWALMESGITNPVVAFRPNGTDLFAATYVEVFRSTDNGSSWVAADSGLGDVNVYDLAAVGTDLFAATANNGIFRSTNNGDLWIQTSAPIVGVWSLAVAGTSVFGTTNGGILLSTDSGTSWAFSNTGITQTQIVAMTADGSTLFAGTPYNGVFRSTDEGSSWTEVNTGLPGPAVQAIAVVPDGTGGTYIVAGSSTSGVYRSTNDGDSWAIADTGMTGRFVTCFVVNGTILFAGSSSGVFRSTDDGMNWVETNTGLTGTYITSLVLSPNGTGQNNMFAGTSGGVFLSSDNGSTWTDVSAGLTSFDVQGLATGQNEAGEAVVLAALQGGGWWGSSGGIYRTTNNGATWQESFAGLTNSHVRSFATIPTMTGNTDFFAGTMDGGLGLSESNGASWTIVSSDLPRSDITALAVSSPDGGGGGTLFAGTGGRGIWRRPLAEMSALPPLKQKWETLPDAPKDPHWSRHDDVFFLNDATGWIVNGDGEIWKTADAGIHWTLQYTAPSYLRSVGFANTQTGWAGVLWDNVDTTRVLYQTTNGGASWLVVQNIPPPLPGGICGIWVVDDSVMYASGRYYGPARVIKTTDRGATWKTIDMSAHAGALVDCYFYSRDSGFVVGSTSSDSHNGYPKILFTADGGETWTVRYEGNRIGELCWKLFFQNSTTGYVSIEKYSDGPTYYLKTTDKGVSWSEKLFLSYRYDVQGIGFVSDSVGWLGGWGGHTYQTTDGGESWHLAGFGYYMNRFRFRSDSLAYAVGRTVYRYTEGQIISSIAPRIMAFPETFRLDQNFPNPFNPSTTISFTLPSLATQSGGHVSSFTSLKVFDLLGREVATLMNELLGPGNHTVTWDASRFPSGVYFYRLQAGEFRETKKLLLLR